ncbi:MAG TPA: penicillin-binding protein 2 [Bauldia sp.]|nr:penicillin-binding protein 2 [Bauldia sp.]
MTEFVMTPVSIADELPAAKARVPRDGVRGRIRFMAFVFLLAFGTLAGRLIMFGLAPSNADGSGGMGAVVATSRPDLVDRNGQILATDVKMASLYAEPRNVLDPDEATEQIATVLPDIDATAVRKKLSTDAGFVWIKREITPEQEKEIHDLGIPGLGFLSESRRFYPGGDTAAHIVGLVNVDNQGIAGFEKYVDDNGLADLHAAGFGGGTDGVAPVMLSIDARVQHIVHDTLADTMTRYHALAAAGVVLNAKTGEVLAMASLPDFDPNNPVDANDPDHLNRMTAGAYELGSVFKSFTFAASFDSGAVKMSDIIDASQPIHADGFTIHDFHAKARPLTVPEVFIFSSNIGAAHMAMKVGTPGMQAYLRRFGLLTKLQTDLPEVASPILPKRWTDLTTMNVAFGQGVAVTPMQTAVADAALVNGGWLIPPTFQPRTEAQAKALAVQVVKPYTSDELRYLFRLNVEKGSGRSADVPGYMVGGKTGTAQKVIDRHYSNTHRINSFLAAFPIDDPQYVVLVMLDDPQAEKEGAGTTAGSNAAPAVGAIIRRSAALLGVEPREDKDLSAVLASN